MAPGAEDELAVDATSPSPDGDDDEEEDAQAPAGVGASFADLLGPDCVIKRVDKDKKVLGPAKPEEMQRELMNRASAQKRLGACAEHVKGFTRAEKLKWALDLKDRANEFYASSKFDEAARLYNDCLVALDLDGTEEERKEVQSKLQLPVCTNLAACMIEMNQYVRCVEICDIALSVDPTSCKALYRRGLAQYRLGNHAAARPNFEAALAGVKTQRADASTSAEDIKGLDDIERRVVVYLGHIRRYSAEERAACKKMFEQPATALYADRPSPQPDAHRDEPIDDSDEAIEAALARVRGSWALCPCRCRAKPKGQ